MPLPAGLFRYAPEFLVQRMVRLVSVNKDAVEEFADELVARVAFVGFVVHGPFVLVVHYNIPGAGRNISQNLHLFLQKSLQD